MGFLHKVLLLYYMDEFPHQRMLKLSHSLSDIYGDYQTVISVSYFFQYSLSVHLEVMIKKAYILYMGFLEKVSSSF